MIRTKIVEVRETDMETANELLKDPHWTLITVVADNSAQKVKYVLKRKGTYDDKELLLPGGTDIDKSEEPVIDLSALAKHCKEAFVSSGNLCKSKPLAKDTEIAEIVAEYFTPTTDNEKITEQRAKIIRLIRELY